MLPRLHRQLRLLAFVGLFVVLTSQGFPFGGGQRSNSDLYSVLGLRRGATASEIKKAFRQKARVVHPDLKETAEEKELAKAEMSNILRAYEVLSDPSKKEQYDRFGIIPGENGAPSAGGAAGGGGSFPNFPHGGGPGFHFRFGEGGFDPFWFSGQYQRAEPIKSKTASITTVEEYDQLAWNTRRNGGVLLVEAYHDACGECRLVSGAWENLANSGWAYGAVTLRRIAMDQPAGVAVLEHAEVSYGPAPVIFAVVQGHTFVLSQLPGVLFRERQQFIQPMIFDFVASFFQDTPVRAQPIVDSVPQFLRDARESTHRTAPALAVSLYVSNKIDNGLAESLSTLSPHLTRTRVVATAVLAELLRCLCNQRVDGTVTDLLAMIPTNLLSLWASQSSDSPVCVGAGGAAAPWCSHSSFASSSLGHLSSTRAAQFVRRRFAAQLRAPHSDDDSPPQERTVALLESASLVHHCQAEGKKGCVALVVANCSAYSGVYDVDHVLAAVMKRATEDRRDGRPSSSRMWPTELLENVAPFAASLLCLDMEPQLDALLRNEQGAHQGASGGAERGSGAGADALDGSWLVVLADGHGSRDAGNVFWVPRSIPASNPWGFHTLLEFLAEAVVGNNVALRPFRCSAVGLQSLSALAGVLTHRPLVVATWRWWYWRAAAAIESLSSLLSLLPLLLAWMAWKWMGRDGERPPAAEPRGAPPQPEPRQPTGTETLHRPQGPTMQGRPDGSPSRTTQVSRLGLPYLTSSDMKEAEQGKGFLILLFDPDERSIRRQSPTRDVTLPRSLFTDSRIQARVVPASQTKWWAWLRELRQQAGNRPELGTADEASDDGGGMQVVAVRKSRLTCGLKPAHTPLAVWVEELVDGTTSTTIPFPS